jgi:hypothetical protein
MRRMDPIIKMKGSKIGHKTGIPGKSCHIHVTENNDKVNVMLLCMS